MKQQLKAGQFTLTERQIDKIIAGATSFRDRIILKLMAGAGMRREETASLQIADIDFPLNRFNVLGKGDKLRVIPASGKIFQDLKFYLDKRRSGWVFPAKKKPGAHLGVSQINVITAAAGVSSGIKNPNPKLKHINPHILRHSYARILKNRGIEIEVLQSILGHNSFNTTYSEYGLLSVADIQKKLLDVLD